MERLKAARTSRSVSSPLGPASQLCPRCLGNLVAVIGFDGWIGLAPPKFICKDCGYCGNAHLEPDRRLEAFTRRAREFACTNESPWEANPRRMGQPSKNDPRAMVVCLLLKERLAESNRGFVQFLSGNKYLWPTIGLSKLPGRMDLQRAKKRLSKEYLAKMSLFVAEHGVAREGQSVPVLVCV